MVTQQHCWTTSWGVSTRMVGAVIMAHGDDQGLGLAAASGTHSGSDCADISEGRRTKYGYGGDRKDRSHVGAGRTS